jgi:hypothetical protein
VDKQNRLLTALALLLLVGVAFLVLDPRRDKAPESNDEGPPTHELFGYKADEITAYALTAAAGTLSFEKKEGNWSVVGGENVPLDQRKVSEVVDRFATLKVEERDLHGADADYGLDEAQRVQVDFTGAEGKHYLAWVGADTTVGYRTYLRESATGPVQLASSKIGDLVHRTVQDFRSTAVWTFSAAQARRVVIETSTQNIVLRKDDHGWWLGDTGPRADDEAVRTWLYAVESLRAESFLDGVDAASVGLSPPAATLRVEDDAGTHTLALAAPGAQPGRVAQGETGLVRLTPDAADPVKVDGWVSTKLLPVRRIQIDTLDLALGDRQAHFTRAEGAWSDAAGKPAIAVDGLLDKIEAVAVDRSVPAAKAPTVWGRIVVAEGDQRKEEVDFGPAVNGTHAAWDVAGGPAFTVKAEDVAAIAGAVP